MPKQIGTTTTWGSISVGLNYTLAVQTNGTLWAWGSNDSGQLGTGTYITPFFPQQIGTATSWRQVSARYATTLALRMDGTLWSWGANNLGQLGLGEATSTSRSTPTPMQVGTVATWESISVGMFHAAALRTDGTLWAWGANSDGQVGSTLLSLEPQLRPNQIGTATTWQRVATGARHTLALRTDGTLWSWGNNETGQLGSGLVTYRPTPEQVGSATTWRTLAVGWDHSVAVQQDGTLWAWGNNEQGQLGDGTTTNRQEPMQIGTATTWVSVAAGNRFTVALRTDGTLWSWGNNEIGQLGSGTPGRSLIPTQVESATTWRMVATGSESAHVLAIRTDGTLWAWGSNLRGQVGDGTTTPRLAPVQISTATSWQTVVAYGPQSAALRADGTLWVWGNNQNGQLGDGTTTSRTAPVQVGEATTWQQLAVGGGQTLALRTDGSLWVWGANDLGQLGNGLTTGRTTPSPHGTAGWQQLSAGMGYSAAIKSDGTLWAWGRGALGEPAASAVPLLILGSGSPLATPVKTSSLAASLVVAPNPAHEEVRLPTLRAGIPVQLLDVTGRPVRTGQTPSLSVRGLAPGLYLLQAFPLGSPSLTTRLVVE